MKKRREDIGKKEKEKEKEKRNPSVIILRSKLQVIKHGSTPIHQSNPRTSTINCNNATSIVSVRSWGFASPCLIIHRQF